MIAVIAATMLSTVVASKPKRKHRTAPPRDISIAAERVERRRAVRLAIIAALTRREAALEDFLVSTATETPVLSVRESVSLGPLDIGPTFVGVDFLGSPIIRSTVRNRSSISVSALLVAHVAGGGSEAVASLALRAIGPGESRRVAMLCPAAIRPTALHWTFNIL